LEQEEEGMTDRSAMQATLDAYFDGLNEERYGDVVALFADRAELTAPGTPRRTRTDLEDYFRAALRPYPEHRDQPTRVVLADSTATVEITFTGALASGDRMEFDAVDVFDFDESGKITRLSSWYDSHAVRARLKEVRERSPAS
jgi:ketosteroid isomerase-like protein